MNKLKATVVAVFAASILAVATTGSLAAEKKEITFAVIATEEMAVVADRWQPTINYLSEKTGLKINFFATTSYAAAVEAMIADFADVAMLGPKIYLVAREKTTKIVPIVGTGRPPNHFLKEPCACYHGRLITKKGGKFSTIASLKGAVLALTDPGSTSGNALPRALFPDEIGGTALDDYFGRIFYAGSHDAAAKAVFNGKADAAFVSENALSRAIDRGALKFGTYNHLWISPEVVSNPIVVNTNTLSPELIAKIKSVLMGMVNDEAGRAALKTVKMAAMPELTDKAFDPLRKILAKKKALKKAN
jgi:phosphonate transport system substrate-binding protein